jgi:photosystem II stability/assembly factor-like uncharacterized protein
VSRQPRLILLIFIFCLAATVAVAETYDARLFQAMEYRLVGPFRGGRVTAVAGVPGRPRTFYMGSTGGGVWKTTDGGIRWRNVSDKVVELDPPPVPEILGEVDERLAELGLLRPPVGGLPEIERKTRVREGDEFGSASVGAIAVAPSDANVVWVGMGSVQMRGNTSAGDGVYRSLDAGASWRHMGLADAGQIGRVRIHPADPDVVYVAALGHAFGPNETRGVFRTVDGGLSWQQVLFVSNEAGAVDLAMDPANPRVLYAAFWQAKRQPWDMISGGPGSGLYKTVDGGNTWVELTEGLPEGTKGKIGVAVSPAAPNRVWALVEHAEEGGLYRSDNGGKSFRRVSADRNLLTRAWYYTRVFADTKDANTVYVLNVQMWRSDDGGKSFRPIPIRTPHGDNHDLWISPDDPRTMIQSNDGGANVTYDGGRSWSTQANQPTAEMYRVSVDDRFPYWLYGGQQDNSAAALPSRTAGSGIRRQDWYAPAGCETAWVAIDPRNADITYGGCYGGSIGRHDRALGTRQQVMAWPQLAVGRAAEELRYRFQWNAPIRISPHDPDVLYHCSNYVHRSRDAGMTWEEISPDLTRDDKSKQGLAGGPITKDNTGVEVYGTIFAFEESPQQAGLLWVGTDDGRMHLSRDAGASWSEITPPGMPEWGTVNGLALSPHDAGRAFAAVHRYRQDDFTPYLFRTDDYGERWQRLTDGKNGIPADHFVRAVAEDPRRKGLIYAGTEFGMYVSFDDGKSWQPFQLNLPVTPITHLVVKDDDLVVATQGRSFWILDDLTPLHELSREVAGSDYHLYRPRAAVQFAGGGGNASGGTPAGRNPSYGAVIRYVLPGGLADEEAEVPEVVLEILDGEGSVLRSLSSNKEERTAPSIWRRLFPELFDPRKLPARDGMNRWVWDLRLADPHLVDDAVLWGGPRGPEVAPGTYRARLTVGEWSSTVAFDVVADPRLDAAQADHEARFALAHEIWRSLEHSHDLLRKLRAVREQVTSLAKLAEDDAVAEASTALAGSLTEIEGTILQTKSEAPQDILNFTPQLDNQLLYLMGVVESATGRPTAASHARFEELRDELAAIESRLDRLLAEELPAFERAVDAAGLGRVIVR